MRRCSGNGMRVRELALLIAATAGTLAVAGCGGSTGPKTGSLTVTITAPGGVTPSVTVTGPGGYHKALAATTTLTGLAVGNYAVGAASVTNTNPIVATVYTGSVTGSPASVTAGATAAATATYAQQPGTGGLWVANSQTLQTAVQYSAGQLASSTSAPPTVAVATGLSRPFAVAFDANGGLWVASISNNVIVGYTASQLASSGTPTAAVTLTANAGSLNGPSALAFDGSGNLWAANIGANTLVQFSASQLGSSGSPVPAVTLAASAGSLNTPGSLAFDASGNLWVGNNGSPGTVVAFSPSQLAANGTPTPPVILTSASNSIVGPLGLAFDASGNLWVSNGNTGQNTIVEFSTSQLNSSGAPTPAVTLTATAGSLSNPTGVAFDNSGNLWIASATTPSVIEFTGSQLVTSGSPTPTVIVSGSSLGVPVGIAFDPHASNLPVKP